MTTSPWLREKGDPSPALVRFTSHAEEQTERFGAAWARVVEAGVVMLLFGDLGAGKTVFARGLVRTLNDQEEDLVVTSPTFTLLNPYHAGRLPVFHFDLYRLAEPEELELIGAEEVLEGQGVTLIEWPERGGGWLPQDHLAVRIGFAALAEAGRMIQVSATGTTSERVWHAFVKRFGTDPDDSLFSL
ncbi:MAG: tRNA (adenosine(37)-N6)-threonylcarbamoyltransferase complex ATPase subunit type 1 TsaE [Magnetococcales bacterium]|nr:tRNA (adenosine(37)-N6)-threonylcarbamoyltransferase complex ATPase subunit type 1 TsaE [Magnetococcales bacterium]